MIVLFFRPQQLTRLNHILFTHSFLVSQTGCEPMIKKAVHSILVVFFLLIAVAVIRYEPSPVYIAFSLIALCFFTMLGFGWISAKKKNPESK